MTETEPTKPEIAALNGPRRDAASGAADSLIIFLHGYGSNGDDLMGLADPLASVLPNTAFSSPNAPERNAFNPVGFQWFPLPWIDGSSEQENAKGFERARASFIAYLDAERERLNLPRSRVALVGFSQGCMMTLQIGPTLDPQLAALVGFSGRLADPARLVAEKRTAPPVFIAHGDMDDVVSPASLEEARKGLEAVGLKVESHMSRGVGHSIAQDGFTLAARFLMRTLIES